MSSIRQSFRSSSKLSIINIGGGLLATAVNILVARRLGPESLGVVGLIQLWQLYAGFARPGFLQAGYREMLHLLGQGRQAEARDVGNIALTAEGGSLFVPLACMALAGMFLYDDPRLKAGMAVAAASFLLTSLYGYMDTMQWAHQRFSLITRANLLLKLSQPALTLAGLYSFGLYGVLAAPAVSSGLGLGYYLLQKDARDFVPRWDARESRRLLRIGLPIALYGFLYWGFRTSDRAMVARWLTLKDLGYFTFAMTFITQGCAIVSDFLNVFQTSLLSELGRVGQVRPLSGKLQRLTLLILLLTGAAAALAQTALHPLISALVPKFLPGVPALEILVLNLVCTTAPLLAYTVLISTVLNQQDMAAIIQAGGLGINIALGYAFVCAGHGLSGIAWSSAISQLSAAAAAYALLHPRLFAGAPARESQRFYQWAIGLLFLVFALHFLMNWGPFSCPALGRLWLPAAFRAVLSVAVWGTAAALLYRYWWKRGLFSATASAPDKADMMFNN
ncbi:MAG: oligosaccharide flippase family protein [Elusimicrobia bacterium]|nr:oligosaccharide flippase family protein [Elusimicrobiota bacterium]